MNVAIVGSGLAGLSAAATLSQRGHQVVVFEQADTIGGVTATIEREGFRWDWGQMMVPDLGPDEPGGRILAELGALDRIRTVPAYRENSFPDFFIRRPDEYGGRRWRIDYLKSLFPEDARGLERYFRLYERVHDLVALSNSEGAAARARLFLKALPIIRKQKWSARQLMDHFISRKELQAVFIAILADYVASPEDFPGLAVPIINAENQYDERVPTDYRCHGHRPSWRFIRGGWIELVRALADVAEEHGAEIRTGSAVTKIVVSGEHGARPAVSGVMLGDGSEMPVDAVIASGGARELFLGLVGSEHLPEAFVRDHVENIALTESVFMVHLGVDYDPTVHQNNAALCYYYLSYDIAGSIAETRSGEYHEGRHGFLVYVPSKYSPEMAPEGQHAVTVYTIAPSKLKERSWDDRRHEYAEALLDIAEEKVPGLRDHEKIRVVLTPDDFGRRTHLARHAFGGSVPSLHRAPPPIQTPVDGLWFVGAQSEANGGVVNALTSARRAVQAMTGEA